MDATKDAPGVCGCGVPDVDSDEDGTMDCEDGCPMDASKTEPGICGCGVPDVDSDGDGTLDCEDDCPADDSKDKPGVCGCKVADTDSDGDGVPDCIDACPDDSNKATPGICGCGVSDVDSDKDGTPDCHDECPRDPNKTEPGVCGCGVSDTDTDFDGTPDCKDNCPESNLMTEPGICGCGVEDIDTDGDGFMDCEDLCPMDREKSLPGVCGCGVPDVDTDGDGVMDCDDECPQDPDKSKAGMCGCGKPDTDSDDNGIPDCLDVTTRSIDLEPTTKEPLTATSTASGDPHFKTWSGDKYDYHGECDLVLVDNPAFADGLGLKIHIRTTRFNYYSYIERVGIQIGDETLEFYNDVENFLLNGEQVEAKKKHHKQYLSGFMIRRDKKAISIRLDKERKNKARIDLIHRRTGFPAIHLDGGGTDIFKGSLGLLGDWATGKRLARDGQTEMNEKDATNFALEWQVRDTEPLLFQDSRFPQYPNKCLPPKQIVGGRVGASHMAKAAEEACAHWKEDKEDCIFDVIATRSFMVAEEGHHSMAG
jgi:hypothetical protein